MYVMGIDSPFGSNRYIEKKKKEVDKKKEKEISRERKEEKAPKKKKRKKNKDNFLLSIQTANCSIQAPLDASSALPRLKPCRPKNYNANISKIPDICK